jgi:3-(3-hydroxy-phenyl)propionate hydroxylase
MSDQPDFEALLRANLKRYPCAELRGDVEVTDIADDGQGRILVTFVDRADGAKHVVEATYVLGCDGANSVARSCIGVGMRDLKFDQRWLVVDIATSADLDQWDGVHQVCDPIRAATYMRIGDARYRWEFRLLPGEIADDFGDLDTLRPLIAPWVDHVALADLKVVRATEYTFRAKIADLWRRGNVFPLGDAAHLTPPFVGQGMGAGLRDAMNLAWKLAGVLNGSLTRSALATYEQERKPHARFMIGMALGMGWAMTAGGDVGNLIRRLVVPRMHMIPGLRDKLVESRTPALRRSAFVTKGRAPWQLAGTLCPNPVVAGGERLDTVLGNGFSMVTTVRPHAFQRAMLEECGAVIHVAERGGDLERWLRRGRATAAIVRPDRTVMRAGRNLNALREAVPQFVSRDCVQPTSPRKA